jgi:Glycogen recognition site of AMP-activated protein kinase
MPPLKLTITYRKQGTTAPVFVAGSFSPTPWQPEELDQETGAETGCFSKTFSISPGTYQYKFRLGTGDWWVVDENQQTG